MGILDKVTGVFNKGAASAKEQPLLKSTDSDEQFSLGKPPQQDPVVEWIVQKRNSGVDDDEIKRILLAHKHTPEAVEDAFRKADVLMSVEPIFPLSLAESSKSQSTLVQGGNIETYQQSQSLAEIENLIDDRIKKVQADIDALQKWKQQVDSDLEQVKTSINQITDIIKDSRDKEREKFEEYDKHLSEVKVELKATQEVFKKGLPEFTKGIQELSRAVKKNK